MLYSWILAAALTAPVSPVSLWIEGEKPQLRTGPFVESDMMNAPRLSGGRLLMLTAEAGQSVANLPATGATLTYSLKVPRTGRFEIWNRMGFESVATPIEWRIGSGVWNAVRMNDPQSPTHLSVDVVELGFWQPIGWLQLGSVLLPAGEAQLQIRIPRAMETQNGTTRPGRVLYASDALVISERPFFPDGLRRPNAPAMPRPAAFALKGTAPRASVKLNGTWEYAPADERALWTDRTGPIATLPPVAGLPWKPMRVPGDRNQQFPQDTHKHRFFLRQRVEVPASMKGRAFNLDFKSISFIATLWVNGQRVGYQDIVRGAWSADVSRFIQPGRSNEIIVGIKDGWYGLTGSGPQSARFNGYLPWSLYDSNQGTTMRFDYPLRGAGDFGILDDVSLNATGPVVVDNVQMLPLVSRGTLGARVLVRNAGTKARTVRVAVEVQDLAGKVVKSLPPVTAQVKPGSGAVPVDLTTAFADGRRWWPDDPYLYRAVARISTDGVPSDAVAVTFGYREWQLRGPDFVLNGQKWPLRADLFAPFAANVAPTATIAEMKRRGITMMRMRFDPPSGGRTPREILEASDQAGMPVRRNAGTFDGQLASYALQIDQMVDGKSTPVANAPLFNNWRRQLANQVRAQWNHASIFAWELDNEIVFINSRNFGTLDKVEPEFRRAAEMLSRLDPTRSQICAGGVALRDESLPTYGIHYGETADRDYPDEAYTMDRAFAKAGKDNWSVWPFRYGPKPIFFSETAYLPGREPSGFAAFGGERVFSGRAETVDAAARYTRMISEGYRWRNANFHLWLGEDTTGGKHYVSFQPVAALVREWDTAWAAGSTVPRTVRFFNETRNSEPLEFAWQLKWSDGQVEGQSRVVVPPGEPVTQTIPINVPALTEDRDATWTLTLRRGNRTEFTDTKAIRLLAPSQLALPNGFGDGTLVVWDPTGEAASRLLAQGIKIRRVATLDDVPEDFRLLVVGRNAVTDAQSTDMRWMRWAAAGRKILVLEQRSPLHYQAVPADFEVAPLTGRVGFRENAEHPIFRGIQDSDFFTWSADHVLYRTIYRKAARGAKSLLHADDALGYSVIAQCDVEDGLLLLCQAVVGEKLATNPVAQRLFDQMVEFAAGHQVIRRSVVAVMTEGSPASTALASLGVRITPAKTIDDALKAADTAPPGIVVAEASPANLAALQAQGTNVRAFTERGGWVMLLGITAEGLPAFNQLVGVDHILRPFRREKVSWPGVRDPLTAGLTLRDVVMVSGERLYGHAADTFYADDAFSSIVDLDDIAPFAEWPAPTNFNDPATKGPGDDTWPLNMVNGIDTSESWKYVFSIHLDKGDPHAWDITLPREEEILGFSIIPNRLYHELRQVKLTFDGQPGTAQTLNLIPGQAGRQDFAVSPVKGRRITIDLAKWEPRGTANVIGVDNIWIRVRRPNGFSERVRPMLNIGGLVRYPNGQGGIVLNQLAYRENESVPENAQKKRTITAAILRNMGATFAGQRTVVAGEGLTYQPISLDTFANLFLTRALGFPGNGPDLSRFPVGEATFAGVRYMVRDIRTSPLENAITLRGRAPFDDGKRKSEVTGIPVNQMVEAIAFLHTLVPADSWQPRRDDAGLATEPSPIPFLYRVTYADGQTLDIPVRLEESVLPWLQARPQALRGASLAWSAPAPEDKDRQTAVWSMLWTNPRPDQSVKSIDVRFGPDGDRWGTPIVLGISGAQGK